MNPLTDIGNALVEARKDGGITQAELAAQLGVKRQQVQRWEAQAYRSASLERVGRVAEALGFDALIVDGIVRLTHGGNDTPGARAEVVAPQPVDALGEVVARIRAHGDELRGSFGVARLGVYGSFADARQTAVSDVDLLVELRDPTAGTTALAEFLGGILGRDVDVTVPERLRWEIRADVLREVVRVWAA